MWWCDFPMVLVEFLRLLVEQCSGIKDDFVLFIKDGINVPVIVIVFNVHIFS
jgi:hypothetical protein